MAISPELRLRPVVAFDVDGVLRVQHRIGYDQNLFAREITMTRDEYPQLFHGKPRWDEDGKSYGTEHFSVEGAAFIRSLAADDSIADPVWATTWQRWANYYFADVLDIPEIPVAVETLVPEDRNWSHCSPGWKTDQLARQFDGRPLIWIDDNMPDRSFEDLAYRRRPVDRAITLSYRVNPLTGITPADVGIIEDWLETASSSDGQRALRAQYSAALEEDRRDRAREKRRWERQAEISKRTRALVEELFPGQDLLAQDLASLSRDPYGLTPDAVSYALKRKSVVADPVELSAKLRVRGYHRKSTPEEPDEDI